MKPLTKIIAKAIIVPITFLTFASPAISGNCGFSKSELSKFLKIYDANNDQRVSREEFVEYYLKRATYEGREITPDKLMEARKKLEDIFDGSDCNRDGYWDVQDSNVTSMLANKNY